MKHSRIALLILGGLLSAGVTGALAVNSPISVNNDRIQEEFEASGITLSEDQVSDIRQDVLLGVKTRCDFPDGNSKLRFTAVDIADVLGLNPKTDKTVVNRIETSLISLADNGACIQRYPDPRVSQVPWDTYFNDVIGLNNNAHFLSLLNDKQFFPVKISWEDIGRYENSVWGDRISDVGIWVRKDEHDPLSSELALSVRRDSNFRDKVLVVPANNIKVHVKQNGQTAELSLPQRLKELGLSSAARDRNVIVSNQFAVVPVPQASRSSRYNNPARAAFNFSILPYGSTNFVITDVIEGSSNAIVGPGGHQLLYANINGKKAPFTASRAAERQDLLKLERDLKAKGMDVDVQRYYLIQVPLKKGAKGIVASNMGTPPSLKYDAVPAYSAESVSGGAVYDMAVPAPSSSFGSVMKQSKSMPRGAEAGLSKVAIGHGDTEGKYFAGAGYRNQRADEPIRVTVVYFVTPVGKVTQKDMDAFTKAFEAWDKQAIWGGSFVTPKENG